MAYLIRWASKSHPSYKSLPPLRGGQGESFVSTIASNKKPPKTHSTAPVAVGAARVSGGSCSKSDYIKQLFSKLVPRVQPSPSPPGEGRGEVVTLSEGVAVRLGESFVSTLAQITKTALFTAFTY